ncbi:MAG: glucose-6-phosphate dehydrogenase, partial [Gammaproteobacteria bacterium]|nr:glucose-6-phosphate dehydrogenase [Gammaproteobacteria bacterium]
QSAYERLIGDAMRGDATLFTRQDIVEEAWRIVDDALVKAGAAQLYATGSWGPEAAARLTRAVGGWVNPGSLGSDACA